MSSTKYYHFIRCGASRLTLGRASASKRATAAPTLSWTFNVTFNVTWGAANLTAVGSKALGGDSVGRAEPVP